MATKRKFDNSSFKNISVENMIPTEPAAFRNRAQTDKERTRPLKRKHGSDLGLSTSRSPISQDEERSHESELSNFRKKNSWLFSQNDLASCTPSLRAKDSSPEQELVQRAKGINFIVQVGTQLKVPQMTINAAATFFHRFYMRFTLKKYHYYDIGGTCIFLACKVEESNRRIRDVVVACTKVATKNPKLVVDEQSKDFWRWRDTIMYNEEVLLEALCFDLTLESPYQLINSLAEKFHLNKVEKFCRNAWGFVNDACRTPMCLCFPTRVIAAAAFYWSSVYSHIPIRGSSTDQKWFEEIGMTENELIEVCNYMAKTSSTLRTMMPGLESTLKYITIAIEEEIKSGHNGKYKENKDSKESSSREINHGNEMHQNGP